MGYSIAMVRFHYLKKKHIDYIALQTFSRHSSKATDIEKAILKCLADALFLLEDQINAMMAME